MVPAFPELRFDGARAELLGAKLGRVRTDCVNRKLHRRSLSAVTVILQKAEHGVILFYAHVAKYPKVKPAFN